MSILFLNFFYKAGDINMNFGIIAEYNPFHKGHFYHICKSKEITESENCVVVMSGNFVQRGDPAILNKHTRTKFALLNGASIVLELPVPFATGSADIFAYGAINLLNKTNIIDFLCFGGETDDIEIFEKISEILTNEPAEFQNLLKNELSKGISYPKARHNALSLYMCMTGQSVRDKDISFLKMPNNILAIEYMKALKNENSSIKPKIIKRNGDSFHQTEIFSEKPSATAIRNSVEKLSLSKNSYEYNYIKENIKRVIPENIYDIFFKEIREYPKTENYLLILDYLLRIKTKEEISKVLDITEGLENRIFKYRDIKTINEFLNSVKTKRYTLTKIRHALLHIILDIKKTDVLSYKKTGLPYIRVLGFRKDKLSLLKELSKKASVPVITNIKAAEKTLSPSALFLLNKEKQASDLYYMTTTKKINTDYTNPIVIV